METQSGREENDSLPWEEPGEETSGSSTPGHGMYALKRDLLKKGDIILVRREGRLSERIRRHTGASFDHVQLYRGAMSILESEGLGVRSFNIERLLFAGPSHAKVYRLKDRKEEVVDFAVQHAASLVGMEFDTAEARRAAQPDPGGVPKEPRRQYCARYVAQSYEAAGHPLVENSAYCSPKNIEDSEALVEVPGCLRPARPSEIRRSKEEPGREKGQDIISYQETMRAELLQDAREEFDEAYDVDIQTLGDLLDLVREHPETDERVNELVKTSGYLDDWKTDERKHPQRYDLERFESDVPEEEKLQKAVALAVIGLLEVERHQPQHILLEREWLRTDMKLGTFESFARLYERLAKQGAQMSRTGRRYLELKGGNLGRLLLAKALREEGFLTGP